MQFAISASEKVSCSWSAEKKQFESEVKYVAINSIFDEATAAVPKLEIPVKINDLTCTLELDTVAGGSFLSVSTWEQLGRPRLQQTSFTYQSASSHSMPVQGCFTAKTLFPKSGQISVVSFMVTAIPGLNLLGRSSIKQMGISLDRMLYPESIGHSPVQALTLKQDVPLQRACQQLCEQFPELFQSEMGCLKDFEPLFIGPTLTRTSLISVVSAPHVLFIKMLCRKQCFIRGCY